VSVCLGDCQAVLLCSVVVDRTCEHLCLCVCESYLCSHMLLLLAVARLSDGDPVDMWRCSVIWLARTVL